MNILFLNYLAQAYGTSAYGQETYTCPEGQTTCEAPGAPNTGTLMQEQPVFFFGGIVLAFAILYAATLLILKKVRSSKA